MLLKLTVLEIYVGQIVAKKIVANAVLDLSEQARQRQNDFLCEY